MAGMVSRSDDEKAREVDWAPDDADRRSAYKTPIFLSYPKPCNVQQQTFISRVCRHLEDHDFAPRTLGVTDYNLKAPLHAIRKLMSESYGLITVAFRRTYLEKATGNYRTDIDKLSAYDLSDTWMTSPWAHIEPAMAYQVGLPIMLLRESGVLADGILKHGVVGLYMPEFDLEADAEAYLQSLEWRQVFRAWETDVRAVENHRGDPPKLY